MSSKAISLILIIFFFSSCDTTDLRTVSDEILGSGTALSSADVSRGLKEALKTGANAAGASASKTDGFFKNKELFIPFPNEIYVVKKRLDSIGLTPLTNSFIKSMNRAAEDASTKAAPIFISAITKMSISDAWGILKGNDNAATEYLKKTTSLELSQAFAPVIKKSLDKVDATKYWGQLTTKYNSIPLVKPVKTNLQNYVTERALDGLFLLVQKEEKKIRDNPMDYTQDIIRKVFGQQKVASSN